MTMLGWIFCFADITGHLRTFCLNRDFWDFGCCQNQDFQDLRIFRIGLLLRVFGLFELGGLGFKGLAGLGALLRVCIYDRRGWADLKGACVSGNDDRVGEGIG